MGSRGSAQQPLDGGDGFSNPASAATTVISGEVGVPARQAPASVPVESIGQDLAGAATL